MVVDCCVWSGIAFAQFKSKEAAEKCIAAAEDESEVRLNIMLKY